MAKEDSIERIIAQVRSLGRDEVAEIGDLPAIVHRHWRELRTGSVVLTQPQREHMFERHQETKDLLLDVVLAVIDPDEIHPDKDFPDRVVFWREIEGDATHWMRTVVVLDTTPPLQPSILTAWRTRQSEFRRQGRKVVPVWKREERI